MARSNDYSQSVIGVCGHICAVWPQISRLGEKHSEVICEECTRQQLGIPENEQVGVWVRVAEKKAEPFAGKPAVKKRKAPVVRCSLCRVKGHTYTDCPLMHGQLKLPVDG